MMFCGKRISLSSKNQRAVISFCTALARSKEQPMARATRRRLVSTTSQPLNAEEPGRVAAASLPLTTVATKQPVIDVSFLVTGILGAAILGNAVALSILQAKMNNLLTEMEALRTMTEELKKSTAAFASRLQEDIKKINKERAQPTPRGPLGYIFAW